MLSFLVMLSAAHAQSVVADGETPSLNAQEFRPSIDSRPFFWITDTSLLQEKKLSYRGLLSYSHHPLVYYPFDYDETGEADVLVSGITELDLMAGYVTGPARIGVSVPVYLRAGGAGIDETTGEIADVGATGLGDIMLDVKVQLMDREEKPVGLSFSARSTVPTATTDLALGTDGLLYELEGGLDKPMGSVLLSANLGHRGMPKVELENATWGPQIYARLGAAYAFNSTSGAGLEFSTSGTYADFGNAAVMPTEGLLGVWHRMDSGLALHGGVGAGLSKAVSAPLFRVMFSAAYDPMGPRDKDLDGIVDKLDACPDTPEDKDGVKDTDGCPEATIVSVVIVDQWNNPVDTATWTEGDKSGTTGGTVELFGGTYSFSAMAEGYKSVDASIQVPDADRYEVKIQMPLIMGRLKVVAKDTAGNVVPNAEWRLTDEAGDKPRPAGESVEVKPGEHTILAAADGYKSVRRQVKVIAEAEEIIEFELLPAKAIMKKDKIEIREVVYFETNKAIIKPESYGLLDDVSDIIKEHPELTLIRIEGHTDSRGNDAANKTLSQNRANSVRDYMVNKGVAKERLEAVGWGEEKLLVKPEKTDGDRSKNRRVEFFVAGRSDSNVEGELKQIDLKDDTTKPDAPK